MLSILDRSVIEALVGSVIRYFGHTPNPATMRELYLQSINNVRPIGSRIDYDCTKSIPQVYYLEEEGPLAAELLRHLDESSKIGLKGVPVGLQDGIVSNLSKAYTLLAEYNPDLPAILSTLVGCYVAVDCPKIGGASFADLMGVVLLSAHQQWTVVDYADSVLHEGVHQSLFLLEMVCGLFTTSHPEMERDESTFVLSSIKQIRRPYSLSFHAAAVSYSLVGLYLWLGNDNKAQKLKHTLLPTVEELVRFDHMLNSTGKELLSEMTRGLEG